MSTSQQPRRAIVVGSGFGGLATAMRMLAAGLDVTVVERLPEPGGRASQLRDQGYTWDLGPSLVTMPWCFDELFALLDRDFRREVELIGLDPFYRIDWPHDVQITSIAEAFQAVKCAKKVSRFKGSEGYLFFGHLEARGRRRQEGRRVL